jgi:hypothetical protein
MGFRYIEGPSSELFIRRFGIALEDAIPRSMEKWKNLGLMQNGRTALNGEGLLFLNRFLLDCFAELDEML